MTAVVVIGLDANDGREVGVDGFRVPFLSRQDDVVGGVGILVTARRTAVGIASNSIGTGSEVRWNGSIGRRDDVGLSRERA